MSAQIGKDPESTPAVEAPDAEPKKTLWERIPRHIFHGRVRTTTAALVVLFIAALFLYGQRSDHYANLDQENRQNQISRVQAPRTTPPEPVQEEPTETTTPSTTTTPTTTAPPTGEESSSSSSEVPTTTTTTPGGGFRLPELPTISIAP
ncbi:hypothetical protein [Williamsia soli]|uniref:hypothetical protein n=1 Tax=Williamsia soli TaxID=364929 RepID=UPI001F31A9BE|nr:hypothetical protein [Williamsia soli]